MATEEIYVKVKEKWKFPEMTQNEVGHEMQTWTAVSSFSIKSTCISWIRNHMWYQKTKELFKDISMKIYVV